MNLQFTHFDSNNFYKNSIVFLLDENLFLFLAICFLIKGLALFQINYSKSK